MSGNTVHVRTKESLTIEMLRVGSVSFLSFWLAGCDRHELREKRCALEHNQSLFVYRACYRYNYVEGLSHTLIEEEEVLLPPYNTDGIQRR